MVETINANYPRFERSGFATATLALSAVLLAVGLAPRNERALFLRDDSGLPVKAFTAVVAPLDAVRAQLERGALDGIGALRSRRPDAGATGPGSRRFVASGVPLLPGTIPALISNAPQPTGADSLDNNGAAAGGGSPSGATPAPTGGEPTGPGGTPGTGVLPPGIQSPTAGAPGLAPLPEPATWAMLLIGFFAIGGLLRRPIGLREAIRL